MTPTLSEMRVACAEECGWIIVYGEPHAGAKRLYLNELIKETLYDGIEFSQLPDYPTDLNAMHEAVASLLFSKRKAYRIELQSAMSQNLNGATVHISECIDATAAQRCEAFLRVKRPEMFKQQGEK